MVSRWQRNDRLDTPGAYDRIVRIFHRIFGMKHIRIYKSMEKKGEMINNFLTRLENSIYRNGSTHISQLFLLWLLHFKNHSRYREVLEMLVEIASNQGTFDAMSQTSTSLLGLQH